MLATRIKRASAKLLSHAPRLSHRGADKQPVSLDRELQFAPVGGHRLNAP